MARLAATSRIAAHRSAIKLDFSISHDRNSVLILCIIVVVIFFVQGSSIVAGSATCCPPPCQRPCLELAREFFFQFCDEASYSFTPGSDCRTLVLFSKLAVRPSSQVENARSSSAGRYGRMTNLRVQNIGKERGIPQVKSMLNALGKTDRCLVGVVLFARLECLRRTLPIRPREKKPALKKALNLVESFKFSWRLYRG